MFPANDVTGKERGVAYQRAITICDACPVRADCLEWALADPDPVEGGVVAGLTPHYLGIARRSRATERRENYIPKCGSERGYVWHLDRGEECEICTDAHNRKGQRYAS